MEDILNDAFNYICQIFKKNFLMLKHSLDVYCLVKNLYWELPDSIRAEIDMANLLAAALLHDIGMMPIPRGLLLKTCELTSNEKELIKYHALYGRKMLEKTAFESIAGWVFYHHEREDGTGYFGLTKEQTPFESKIIAVADTFSALTLRRFYCKYISVRKAINILNEAPGTQLDENLVVIFCGMIKKQRAFRRRIELYKLLIPLLLKAHFYY